MTPDDQSGGGGADAATPSKAERFVEPVRSARTFERVIEHLIEGIERTGLRAGDRLPLEEQLAQQLGVSKATLRQALRVLERAGLLTVKRGKNGGIFLATNYLPLDAIEINIVVEEHECVDILWARRVVEGAVTRFVTLTATEEHFAEIERTIDLLRESGPQRALSVRANQMFHRAVARASENDVLQEIMKTVFQRLAPVRDVATSQNAADDATLLLDIHERQLAAMRDRDLARLELILDEHFRVLEERFAAALGREWDDLFGAERAPARLPGL